MSPLFRVMNLCFLFIFAFGSRVAICNKARNRYKRGISILCLWDFLSKENKIHFTNIIVCANDVALPIGITHLGGFIAFLEKVAPGVFTVYCVNHDQHLIAEILSVLLYSRVKHCYPSKK